MICVPLFIIILQNDTGSGIVLGSFLFVLYREGLNKWLCIPALLIAALLYKPRVLRRRAALLFAAVIVLVVGYNSLCLGNTVFTRRCTTSRRAVRVAAGSV